MEVATKASEVWGPHSQAELEGQQASGLTQDPTSPLPRRPLHPSPLPTARGRLDRSAVVREARHQGDMAMKLEGQQRQAGDGDTGSA